MRAITSTIFIQSVRNKHATEFFRIPKGNLYTRARCIIKFHTYFTFSYVTYDEIKVKLGEAGQKFGVSLLSQRTLLGPQTQKRDQIHKVHTLKHNFQTCLRVLM